MRLAALHHSELRQDIQIGWLITQTDPTVFRTFLTENGFRRKRCAAVVKRWNRLIAKNIESQHTALYEAAIRVKQRVPVGA